VAAPTAGHQTLSTYIQARFDDFSRSQKDVAQYIVDHLDEVAFQTAEELARRANTSSSTVVRFSQALGFEGYPELQHSAREEYRRRHAVAPNGAPAVNAPLRASSVHGCRSTRHPRRLAPRRAHLITLRRGDSPAPPRRTVDELAWVGCEIDEIPLRVRASAPATGDALLQPLLDGAILPSVSRRDPRREQAALWTSRNRVYASADPPALVHALSCSAVADRPPQLRAELSQILAAERAEHGLPALAVPSHDRAA
jgi:hypothetical protein